MATSPERIQELMRIAQGGASTSPSVSNSPKKTVPEKKSFLTSTDPTYKASMGGAESVPENVVKTFGNIPSSGRNLIRSSIAPVNPLDRESPINIGSNIVKGFDDVKAIANNTKTIGIGGTLKSLAGGVGEVAKKGYDIYRGVGEKIYNNLEQNTIKNNLVYGGFGSSITEVMSYLAEKGLKTHYFYLVYYMHQLKYVLLVLQVIPYLRYQG